MSLRDIATSTARDTQADQAAKRQAGADADNAKQAADLSARFGMPFVYQDTVVHTRYLSRSGQFGGVSYRAEKVTYRHFVADDVLFAVKAGQSGSGEFGIYRACKHCNAQHVVSLGYSSDYRKFVKDDPAEAVRRNVEWLVAALGAALIAPATICTVCQAQPCPTCGHVR